MYIRLDGRVYVLNICCQKRLARPKRLHRTQPRWCGAKLERGRCGQFGTVWHGANSGESGHYSLPVQKRRKKRSRRPIEEAERGSREERMQREENKEKRIERRTDAERAREREKRTRREV